MPRNGVRKASDERFPSPERLRLRLEYERVYGDGRPFRTSLVVLFVLTAPDLSRKAGFVAGRRVGGAVSRNRAKRLLRESYRRHKDLLPESGVHLVFIARAGCGEAAYAEVEHELIELLAKAGFPGKVDRDEGDL